MVPSYDVIVIGLGGMGSAAAQQLARRGQRVLGLDRHGPAHDRGSSHGESRVVRQAYAEDPAYVPLLLRGYELWEWLERDSGRELLTVTGGLVLGSEDSRTVQGGLRSAQQWGLAHELLEAGHIRRRFPTMTPARDVVGFYEHRAGLVSPEASVSAHLQLAERAGAWLRFHEPVTAWHADSSGEGVRVETPAGRYTASRMVVCPGAWAPEVLADLDLAFCTERYVQYWFDPVGSLAAYRPGRHPVFTWETGDGRLFDGFPALGGRERGVKVSFVRGGRSCTPKTIDRTVRPAEVEVVRAYLRPRIPTLAGTVLQAATCLYTYAPDRHFVLGAHPDNPQVIVGCGLSGRGFAFVPAVGEILADLTIDGASRHDIDLCSPRRSAAA